MIRNYKIENAINKALFSFVRIAAFGVGGYLS